jgi:hypothetical protein
MDNKQIDEPIELAKKYYLGKFLTCFDGLIKAKYIGRFDDNTIEIAGPTIFLVSCELAQEFSFYIKEDELKTTVREIKKENYEDALNSVVETFKKAIKKK